MVQKYDKSPLDLIKCNNYWLKKPVTHCYGNWSLNISKLNFLGSNLTNYGLVRKLANIDQCCIWCVFLRIYLWITKILNILHFKWLQLVMILTYWPGCLVHNFLYNSYGVILLISIVPFFWIDKRKWEKVAVRGDPPAPRTGSSLVAVGDSLYLFGGLSHSTGWLDDLYKLDTSKHWCVIFHRTRINLSSVYFLKRFQLHMLILT